MTLKTRLKDINRKLRKNTAYDALYRRFHAAYIKPQKDDAALYYHSNYAAVPVVDGVVLLDSFWGRTIGCNPYALYLEMRADPRCAGFRYIWVCNDKAAIPQDMRNDPAVRFVAYQTMDYQKALLEAQYLIGNCNFPPHFLKKDNQIYINTWHGTPIKHIGLNADSAFAPSANTQRNYFASDYILSYSPAMTERTVVAYGAQAALDRVYEVGTPRVDLTLKTPRADVRRMLGVADGKDVLLYAPTWRGTFGQQNQGVQEQIAAIQAIMAAFSDSHEVFVSVHHITAQAFAKKNITLRTVPDDIPINTVLAGVDFLVSDYSSITVDYFALDRPVALYCPDYDNYTQAQGLHDDLATLPAAFCKTLPALRDAVAAARKPSDFDSFAQYKDLLFGLEDGQAAKRSLDIVLAQTPATAYPRDDRKRVVVYAGGLMPNGITSSIIALSNAIDHQRYQLSIVFDAPTVDKSVDRVISVEKLHPACDLITRSGATTYTHEERRAYNDFASTGRFSSDQARALVDAAFARETRRIFGMQTFDVAIDFSGYGTFWSLIMSKVTADRHLIYQHNDMYREAHNTHAARSFPELQAVFALYERFTGTVSVTPDMMTVNYKNLADYYPAGMERLTAENVVNENRILQRADVPLALVSPQVDSIVDKTDLYLFCCVARLSPEKNHARLLAAFAKVLEKNPQCALLILGDGKIAGKLRKEAQRLRISDHVLFLGHCENPYPIIKACDCKVLASHYEGQGIVLLEALALGARCIATDNPAVRTVLQGGLGTVVPQDTDALADAMLAASQETDPAPVTFDTEAYSARALDQFYACLESTAPAHAASASDGVDAALKAAG